MLDDFRVGVRQALSIESRASRVSFRLSLAILALHWLLVLRFVAVRADSLDFLRLHYGVAFGIDWYDRWWFVFTFPLLGLFFLAVNVWLAIWLARLRPSFSAYVHGTTVLLQTALAAAGVIALLLNS